MLEGQKHLEDNGIEKTGISFTFVRNQIDLKDQFFFFGMDYSCIDFHYKVVEKIG